MSAIVNCPYAVVMRSSASRVLAERAERDAEVEQRRGVHLHVARRARMVHRGLEGLPRERRIATLRLEPSDVEQAARLAAQIVRLAIRLARRAEESLRLVEAALLGREPAEVLQRLRARDRSRRQLEHPLVDRPGAPRVAARRPHRRLDVERVRLGVAHPVCACELGAGARARDRVVPLRLQALHVGQSPPRLGRDVGALVRALRDLDDSTARARAETPLAIVADPVVEQCGEVVALDARAHDGRDVLRKVKVKE